MAMLHLSEAIATYIILSLHTFRGSYWKVVSIHMRWAEW